MSVILRGNMTKQWRQVLGELETKHKNRMKWEEEHPPITRVSTQEADGKRRIQAVGQEAVTCDLPCQGNHIPNAYSHTRGIVNVRRRGIIVKGWENPVDGEAGYFGTTCDLTDGKICVATDERLRKAIER